MDHANIEKVLSNLLAHLSLEFESISVADEGEFTRVDITANEPSRIIGWHGETLNSLQHVLKAIIRSQEGLEKSPFIVLDVDGYRRDQEDRVRKLAEQKADFVRKTGNRVALAPMSPYFRRIVHLHIANSPNLQDLTTESSGEGEYRQVVMRLQKEGAPKKESDEGELSPVLEEDGDGLGNLDI